MLMSTTTTETIQALWTSQLLQSFNTKLRNSIQLTLPHCTIHIPDMQHTALNVHP
jgi:hypothetical protein